MRPRGRLRKALKLLDAIDEWNDRHDAIPLYVMDALYEARGLVAVTVNDIESGATHAAVDPHLSARGTDARPRATDLDPDLFGRLGTR